MNQKINFYIISKVVIFVLITCYKIKNKQARQEKNKEERRKRRQLNSIMMCLTKAPHTSIYRISRGMSYIMKFNEMDVTYMKLRESYMTIGNLCRLWISIYIIIFTIKLTISFVFLINI